MLHNRYSTAKRLISKNLKNLNLESSCHFGEKLDTNYNLTELVAPEMRSCMQSLPEIQTLHRLYQIANNNKKRINFWNVKPCSFGSSY
jgi:hypothetical protein